MDALSLYNSADLGRHYSGDALDALLSGGRKRRTKKRRAAKHHSADALFAAILDGAKRRRKSTKARKAPKRRTPPRDPRTGLFLKRGAKKSRKHRADFALDLALFGALDMAKKRRRKAPRRKAAHVHPLLGAALYHAAKKAKKPARRRSRSYLDPSGFPEADLPMLMKLGFIKPTEKQAEMSEKDKFFLECSKSPSVRKICEEKWTKNQIVKALAAVRALTP